jgi:hypothetical protein
MTTDTEEALNVLADWFWEDHPSGYYTRGGGYNHKWTLRVADGVGILRVTMEDVNSLITEDFEWELNLRS